MCRMVPRPSTSSDCSRLPVFGSMNLTVSKASPSRIVRCAISESSANVAVVVGPVKDDSSCSSGGCVGSYGLYVGSGVGVSVGCGEGSGVGVAVGVGAGSGVAVGSGVGDAVASGDGVAVGVTVGSGVGCDDVVGVGCGVAATACAVVGAMLVATAMVSAVSCVRLIMRFSFLLSAR